MKINGYEVALSEADLDDKLNNQTVDVDLIKPDFPAYRQLSDGDKKAFAHLVKAARMFNDVFLDKEPVEIFKGVKGNPGRNFYPDDLSAE